MKKLFALLLALATALTLFACAKAPDPTARSAGSSEEPTENIAYLREDDENEYYCVESDLNYELFRKSKATGEAVSIRKESFISCLTLADGWLYYAANHHDLCRVGVTGDGYEKLLDYSEWRQYKEDEYSDGDDIRIIYVIDGVVFFWEQSFFLLRFDPQTQIVNEITADAREIHASGNHVYYCGKDCDICMIGAHDEAPTVILESDKIGDYAEREWQNLYKNFIFIGDTMYYYKRSPDGLYSYRNGESVLIDDENIDEYSMDGYNGKLYYMARREWTPENADDYTSRLMCYDTETGALLKVAECDSYSGGTGYVSDGRYCYQDHDDNKCEIKISD